MPQSANFVARSLKITQELEAMFVCVKMVKKAIKANKVAFWNDFV